LFVAGPAGLSVILASLVARAQGAPPSGEAVPPPPEPTTAAVPNLAEGPKANLGEAPKVTEAPKARSPFNVELYGALLPFLEYVTAGGATPVGFTGGASQVQDSLYTGLNAPRRFRMTVGTTNIGFRGTLNLFENLKVTWQVESGVPLDGDGPPNTFASRNSHIGFTGGWGTLIWGAWDTPWKWATLVTINPINGGFVPDYNAILNTPGFGVSAVNTVSLLQGDITNAAFYRHEPNSIQYWSPIVAGFSVRLNCTINEARPNPADVIVPPPNPYLLSGYLGFDGGGLRVRYAYEMHHDYFGMYNLGAIESDGATSSRDQGHQLTIQYILKPTAEMRTRLVATGEYLSYSSNDPVTDAFDGYSRPAFYALLEQTVFRHRVWVAYGQDFEGKCHRVGGNPCSTTGLGARMGSAGYLYALNANTQVYLAGYRVINDVSSIHSTVPALNSAAPGQDVTGAGMGIFYAFGLPLTP
jgi:predicted porin